MEIENITDSASLYRRVYPSHFNHRRNRFSDAAFMVRSKINEKEMSVNWSKYISPEEAVIAPNTESEFYLGELKAAIPREIELDVIHSPGESDTPHSKSHSSIIGKKLLDKELAYETAGFLADNCEPIIR